eukprot:6200915-Lingulodinium_polyedra.AAC.1
MARMICFAIVCWRGCARGEACAIKGFLRTQRYVALRAVLGARAFRATWRSCSFSLARRGVGLD